MSTTTLGSTSSRALRSLAVLFAMCATSLHGAAIMRSGPDSTAAKNATPKQSSRMHAYVLDLIGPGAIVWIGVGAAIDQSQNDPREWGKTGSGFGKRLASSAGSRFAQVTARHGLAAAMGRSVGYRRCTCTDSGDRITHGVVYTFIDYDRHGRRQFSEPRVAGALAAGFSPLIWHPEYSVGRAAANSAASLALSAAGNVAREFLSWWP